MCRGNIDNPHVSILMTVYNRSDYLRQAIESVIKSKYSSWELIITDDCSTDNSYTIALEYQMKDDRIRVYKNEHNLGDYPNRNKAASYAQGKYLKYLDADDLMYPHSLEIMVDSMEKFPEVAFAASQEVYEDYDPYPFVMLPHETYYREFFKRGVLGFAPSATIIRRDIFESLGGFTGKRYVGDIEFWLKAAAVYPMLKLQSGLVFWRRHEGQEFQLGTQNSSYLVFNYTCVTEALANIHCPLNSDEKKTALKWIDFRHGRGIIHLALKKRLPWKAIMAIKASSFSFLKVLKSFIPWSIYRKL